MKRSRRKSSKIHVLKKKIAHCWNTELNEKIPAKAGKSEGT